GQPVEGLPLDADEVEVLDAQWFDDLREGQALRPGARDPRPGRRDDGVAVNGSRGRQRDAPQCNGMGEPHSARLGSRGTPNRPTITGSETRGSLQAENRDSTQTSSVPRWHTAGNRSDDADVARPAAGSCVQTIRPHATPLSRTRR